MWIRSALLSVAFCSVAVAAESSTLDAVRKANANLSSLKGEFTQKNRMKLFKQELTSTGVLYFRPPRQVRWEYKQPDPSVMIVDGDRATLKTPGQTPQVFDLTKDATMRVVFEQIGAWLAPAGGGLIDRHYDVTPVAQKNGAISLAPRADSPVAQAFSRIELRFDPSTWLLSSILLVEKSGDEKEIVFSKLKRNDALPKDAFAQ